MAKHGYIVSNLQPEAIITLDSTGRSCTNSTTVNKVVIDKTIELLGYIDIVVDRGLLIEIRRDICKEMPGNIDEEIVQVALEEFTRRLFKEVLLKLNAKEKAETLISLYSV